MTEVAKGKIGALEDSKMGYMVKATRKDNNTKCYLGISAERIQHDMAVNSRVAVAYNVTIKEYNIMSNGEPDTRSPNEEFVIVLYHRKDRILENEIFRCMEGFYQDFDTSQDNKKTSPKDPINKMMDGFLRGPNANAKTYVN